MAIAYSTSVDNVDWAALIATLAADRFDNGRTPRQMETSFRNSFRSIIVRDDDRVIGTGRTLSDGVCNAYIVDVWTQSAYRRRGIGRRVIELLCESLRGQHVYLFTDDRRDFYAACGFVPRAVGMQCVVGEWLKNDSLG
ncbi:MAG TPA: GNAT family N-acetyltransferase [Casimicrobiaceae bacterium]|nr:GNAT family N-acetyltransferase [Casimicrobiaceae bacterium]